MLTTPAHDVSIDAQRMAPFSSQHRIIAINESESVSDILLVVWFPKCGIVAGASTCGNVACVLCYNTCETIREFKKIRSCNHNAFGKPLHYCNRSCAHLVNVTENN